MFRDREEMRRRLTEIIEKFRQKGATSPEKAMTIQELGLPPVLNKQCIEGSVKQAFLLK